MLDARPEPRGREAELRQFDRLLVAAAQGPAALVLEGPAGIGKSLLAAAAADEARRRGFEVLATRPSGTEATWAYQALADLLAAVDPAAIDALPAQQRAALDVAMLRVDPTEPVEAAGQARLVSLAALNVLLACARRGPVLLLIDDAPLVDPATAAALAFILPRLGRQPIGVLATQRADVLVPEPLGLANAISTERIWLDPLTMGAVHALLADRLGLTLPRPTLTRLHEMSGGNPFHALEIGRALQRLPTLPRPGESLPVPGTVRDLVRAHLATGSDAARDVMRFVAAAGTLSSEALRTLAGPPAEAALAEAVDLSLLVVEAGTVRFAHPTLASVLDEDTPGADRRRTHARLANVAADHEQRARHLALATIVPDAEVAAALELAAGDAQRRGGIETAAELARLAVERTPAGDPGRGRRGLLLANVLVALPDLPAAAQVARELVETLPPGRDRAEARMLAGTIAWYTATPPVAAAQLLLALEDAAGDAELLGRLHYRLSVFREAEPVAAREHAKAAIALLDGGDAPITLAAAMFGYFSRTVSLGEPPPMDVFERALAIEGGGQHLDQSTVPGLWWIEIGRLDLARARFTEMLERSRAAGEMSGEADLLTRLAETELYADNWLTARQLADEAALLARQEGQPTADPALRMRALIDAHLGALDQARSVAEAGLERSEAANDRLIAASYLQVLGLIAASRGQAADLERLTARAAEHLDAFGPERWRMDPRPDRIEALVALQRLDEAQTAIDELAERGRVNPRPWVDAALARGTCRLLAAQGRFGEAVAATEPATDDRSAGWRRFDRARVLLARGEAFRQARARRESAVALEAAVAIFDELGAAVWSARTRQELARLGARRRSLSDDLTPTEQRVAELAASGLRNREVAEQLGISAKTVEAHLAQVYSKLGIRSRAELGRAIR